MPVYANTANHPYGGRTITIGSQAYVALNWAPNRNTREIRRNDIAGNRSDFRLEEEPVNASVTLQVPNGSPGTVPTMGVTFVVDSRTYVVSAVTKNEPEGDYHTVDVSYTDA